MTQASCVLLDLHCPSDFDPEQPLFLRTAHLEQKKPTELRSEATSSSNSSNSNSISSLDVSVDSDEKGMDLDEDENDQTIDDGRWYHLDFVHGMNAYQLVHGTGSRAVIVGISELSGYGLLKVQTYNEPASTLEILSNFNGGTLNGESSVRARIYEGNNDEISTYLFKGTLSKCGITNGTLWYSKNVPNSTTTNHVKSSKTAQYRMDFEQTWVKRVKKKGYPHHYPADRFIDCYATVTSVYGCVECGHYKVDRDLQMWGKIAWATVSSQLNEWRLVGGVLHSMDNLLKDPSKHTLCESMKQRVSLIRDPWCRMFWFESRSMNSLFSVRSSSTFTGTLLIFNQNMLDHCKEAWKGELNRMGSTNTTSFLSHVDVNCLLIGNFLFDKCDSTVVLPLPIGLIRVFDGNGQCVWDESVLECDITRLQIGTDSLEPKKENSVTPKTSGSRSTVKRKTPTRVSRAKPKRKKATKRSKKVPVRKTRKKAAPKSRKSSAKKASIYDEDEYTESESEYDESTTSEEEDSIDMVLHSDGDSTSEDNETYPRKRRRITKRHRSPVRQSKHKKKTKKRYYNTRSKTTKSSSKSRKTRTKRKKI